MDFWNSIRGIVEVELTSAGQEQTFAAMGRRDIEIRNLRQISELSCCFCIPGNRYRELSEICKKRGDSLKIRRVNGLYRTVKRTMSRPLLFWGGLFLLTLVLWLPSRVLFICVEGNSQIPARRILAAAEDCGISFGASRREVRSEKMKNALLSAVPELQWAGVNTSGCTATISVREKEETENREEKTQVSSILAARDGYILSCTATRGNLLVQPGMSVRKGQPLISAYTDCGICIRAEQAEGEIQAQTNRSMDVLTPSQYLQKGDAVAVKRKFSLLFRKKRIFLWKDSGIWEGSCGRMYEEYYITLPGGFQLPIALCAEEYLFGETQRMDVPEDAAEAALKTFAERQLMQQMVAGKILSAFPSVTTESGRYRLHGEYACVEMIGTVRQKQIGDTNGENS